MAQAAYCSITAVDFAEVNVYVHTYETTKTREEQKV